MSVDLIASGYEWTCPNCGKFHREIEATETVKCVCDKRHNDCGCGKTFETNSPEHALQ